MQVDTDAGGFILLSILLFVIGIGAFVVWIMAIVDAARVPDDSMYRAGNKVTWILVIVLAGVIGAIIYYAVGRPSAETRAYAAARPAAYPGAQSIDYRGTRYALGRTASAYVIWDSAAGGAPIRQYPLTQEGWNQAWLAYYQELEGAPPYQPGPAG